MSTSTASETRAFDASMLCADPNGRKSHPASVCSPSANAGCCAAGVFCALLLAFSGSAEANSTLVAGAAASGTGRVLVAQSTEVPGRAVSMRYRLPAQQHRSQETVPYVDGILMPQVPHTNGLFVTLTRALQPDGRILTRESFLNDKGVLVAQNVLPAAKRLKLSAEELATPVNGLFTDPERLRAESAILDVPVRPASPPDALRYVLPTPSDYRELDERNRRYVRNSSLLSKTLTGKADGASSGKNVPTAVPDKFSAAASAELSTSLEALAKQPRGMIDGLGRLMAERGNSSRQAVTQAVELVERFGWRGPVQEYTVADDKEAWILAVFPGRTAVARRIADNEVVFTAQTSSLGTADLTNAESTIVTDFTRRRARALLDAVRKSIDKPKTADAAESASNTDAPTAGQDVVRPERTVFRLEDHVDPPTDEARRLSHQRERAVRSKIAPDSLADFPADWRAFWTESGWRVDKPLTVEAVKDVLRTHDHGHEPSGICSAATARSDIWELHANPLLVRVTSAEHRPGEALFVPSHPLAAPARRVVQAPEIAFDTDARDVRTIRQLHAVLLALLKQEGGSDADFDLLRSEYERQADSDVAAAEKNALFLAGKVSTEKARQRLWSTDARLRALADACTADHIADMDPVRVTLLADQLKPNASTLRAVIFGSEAFDAGKVLKKSVRLRLPDTDAAGLVDRNLAEASSVVRRDFDGDGRIDAVLNFPVRKLLKAASPDTYLTLYVTGRAGERIFVGFDTILVNAGAPREDHPDPQERTAKPAP